MPITFPSYNTISLSTFVPISSISRYPSQSPSNKHSRLPHVVPSVLPSGDTSYVISYSPNVNLSRFPSEQHIGDIQGKSQTTLKQFKDLEDIIASRDIMVDESAQLQK